MNKRLIKRYRKEIGKVIRDTRTQAGLSQKYIGKRLRTTGQMVGKWERGESPMDCTRYMEICQVLGLIAGVELTRVLHKVNR
jgi:transcriptional regulator with XRE-family HTH domain